MWSSDLHDQRFLFSCTQCCPGQCSVKIERWALSQAKALFRTALNRPPYSLFKTIHMGPLLYSRRSQYKKFVSIFVDLSCNGVDNSELASARHTAVVSVLFIGNILKLFPVIFLRPPENSLLPGPRETLPPFRQKNSVIWQTKFRHRFLGQN